MFIWDFVADNILGQILNWIYAQVVGAVGQFLGEINSMGGDLFDYPWVQVVVGFFAKLGFALYVVGLIVAVFEYAIESQSGRGDLRSVAMGSITGFLAASLFTTVPVALYKLCVSLQTDMTDGISSLVLGAPAGIPATATTVLGLLSGSASIYLLIDVIAIAYCVVKVFFANIKRGGILVIQIAVGSMYMFGIPRGYTDGFINWCKQVIGICLTTFLQSVVLISGLMVFEANALMGIGLMIASTEVPRICGTFGMDTSTRANIMSAVYATQTIVNTTRTIANAASAAA